MDGVNTITRKMHILYTVKCFMQPQCVNGSFQQQIARPSQEEKVEEKVEEEKAEKTEKKEEEKKDEEEKDEKEESK